ncbi:hypothetical protein PTE30175_03608 [Pandoraea terrae]|uniref:Restriction endonuclease type IV Mrr domain-containing protein n=1 Tax=Pandoraea terrae TaxID=1537710 RepID=A0A5E4X6Q7_9BURK|nr:restriction endonuclease [Pandoraea terrae]VVE32061.1 hypothetical protein PTE30175_03608 [Pandoraea terrae]
MNRGFVSTIDRISREFWRAAHARQQQREKAETGGLQAVRDAERARRAYEEAPGADEAARQKAFAAMRHAETAAETARAQYAFKLREHLLAEGLARDVRIPPAELRARATPPPADFSNLPKVTPKPEWSAYQPEKPGRLALAMPGASARFEAAVARARSEFVHAEREHEASKIRRNHGTTIKQLAHQKLTEVLRAEAAAQNAAVAEFEGALLRAEADAVACYARIVLSRSPYPAGFMQTLAAQYVNESRLLVVGYDVPACDAAVPIAASYRHDVHDDRIVAVAAPEAARAAAYASVVGQVALRSLHELFAVDALRMVDAIVFNAYADAGAPDPAGVAARACIASVHVSRAEFGALVWETGDPPMAVDAATQLGRLRARLSAAPAALAPVMPFVEINMTRAVTDADVMVDRRLNLMALPAKDFTQVMFHLLCSLALESAPPQPSEDGSHELRAYDPHPIFGGDVVVHVKRQAAKLDAAAVRAVIAEMQKIGAARGMLLTTAALDEGVEELARNHRVELLAGHNLVFLMNENAGVEASVDVPADWRDAAPAAA